MFNVSAKMETDLAWLDLSKKNPLTQYDSSEDS